MTEYVWQHDLEGERDRLRLMSDLLDPSSEFHLMGTGVTAGWRCLEIGAAVLPSMRRRGGGRIINIGSVLGLIPAPYSAHYSATKHALEGYSESFDHEIRAFNIRIALIEPAYTRSVFEQNALAPDSVLKDYDEARAGARARDVMTTADHPEVVADAVVVAATAARPRRRYTAGKVARQISLLRRFAPAEMFDKSLRKQMRLGDALERD
jgi:short-subunit dehydrogenase